MDHSLTPDVPRTVYRLRAIRAVISATQLIDDQLLRWLLVEDACWRFAMDDLRSRRPRPWDRAHTRQWTVERRELLRERNRIACLARRCGVSMRGR
jgi:hypothetical protein